MSASTPELRVVAGPRRLPDNPDFDNPDTLLILDAVRYAESCPPHRPIPDHRGAGVGDPQVPRGIEPSSDGALPLGVKSRSADLIGGRWQSTFQL
jgi:hypothetical protein